MPISAGMDASGRLSREWGFPRSDIDHCTVGPIGHCVEFFYPILLFSSSLAFIPYPRLLFALSTRSFSCGCFTEVKHWRMHNFSHQSLNALSRNYFPLSDMISPDGHLPNPFSGNNRSATIWKFDFTWFLPG
ncbi:hypothetical protein Tco_0640444 [Tanacetum coccineum]